MRTLYTIVAVAVAAIALSSCAPQLEQAEQMAPGGSPFNIRLYAGYLGLAQDEYNEQDYGDSDTFASRAIAAASGKQVEPEQIAARKLPAASVDELTKARARLMAALDAGARTKAATGAADAQVMFDCWMQEQEENFQPEDIKRCRDGFMAAIQGVEKRLAAPPRRAAAAPPAPQPAPAPQPVAPRPATFIVYFALGGTALDQQAMQTIRSAASAYRSRDKASVTVTGHTDRSGSSISNLRLSLLRAESVRRALTGDGVPDRAIEVRARGETQPRVATEDGVREARNRRVEIVIE